MVWIFGILAAVALIIGAYLLGLTHGRDGMIAWLEDDDDFVEAQREHFPWQ